MAKNRKSTQNFEQNLSETPFTKEQKAIFKFKDGDKVRGIDPLDIHLAFGSMDYDWEAAGQQVQDGNLEALGELIENTRKVFGLKEKEYLTDGTEVGSSSTEVIEVLFQFTKYMTYLKKTTDDLQTSQPNTGSTPPD